ncbi:MAG TPA: phospho-N-acetylmuramoyl-pentapeptide-transferase, partial [Tepidimicrobium sp.]|nr:phospho-N-acetylmuramoyl-pentapeptide-transferase [Tepidimicrobium sp.]
MKYINVFSFILSAILAYIIVPMVFHMLLQNDNTMESNYRNNKVPICMGLTFIFVQVISIGIIIILNRKDILYIVYYLFALVSMGLVGLLDDLIGDNKTKGFKGHIGSILRADLSTGAIKAITGFTVALFVSIVTTNTIIEIIINMLIIALFTNLVNLFDLRPGRASKLFILISIIMLYTSFIKHFNFLLFSFYGILLVYIPMDLNERAMMGDVGSNALGVTLGIFCFLTHSLSIKYLYLLVLIVTHIASERVSFSKIIEDNKILKF